jgi:hypothetical protein
MIPLFPLQVRVPCPIFRRRPRHRNFLIQPFVKRSSVLELVHRMVPLTERENRPSFLYLTARVEDRMFPRNPAFTAFVRAGAGLVIRIVAKLAPELWRDGMHP